MIKGIYILVFAAALMSFDASAWWEKRADFGSNARHRGLDYLLVTKATLD